MAKLFLIPNHLSETPFSQIPAVSSGAIKHLRLFFVEEEKSARRLLKKLNPDLTISDCRLFPLNEHSKPEQVREYLKLMKTEDAGIISESGCPCVADPGADLVLLAHQNNIEIIPLIGPSSVIMALMASGLNGQNFAFNGYLPKDKHERQQRIKFLETRSAKEGQTQIFMETPYRNQSMTEDILSVCDDKTFLCIAGDITGPEQNIKTQTIKDWKKTGQGVLKNPALFLIEKKESV